MKKDSAFTTVKLNFVFHEKTLQRQVKDEAEAGRNY